MSKKRILEAVDKLGEAVAITVGNKKYVFLVAYQEDEHVVHNYTVGEELTRDEFCGMLVELMMGSCGTEAGWEPPEGQRPDLQ
jgi:hypothetical protein